MEDKRLILEVEHLTRSFGGVRAVDDVSFSVRTGERLAVIGPNGAGKSTLIDLLCGTILPDTGRVVFDGKDLTGVPAFKRVRAGIARTFQVTSIFPYLTVYQNIQMALASVAGKNLRPWSSFKPMFKDEAGEILQKVGVFKQRDQFAAALSHGDQRALELGIAVACRPKLLFMDEPTQGMSGPERVKIMDLVKTTSEDLGITIVFTEHNIDSVFALATEVMVLNRGQVLIKELPEVIRADQRVIDVYLGNYGKS